MLDFKDKNPYEILDVSPNDFAPKIERQLRHKLSLYCSLDRDATDINGYNLKNIFEEATKILTTPELKKQLDERLRVESLAITKLQSIINLIRLKKGIKEVQEDQQLTGYITISPTGTIYHTLDKQPSNINIPITKVIQDPKTNIVELLTSINIYIINNPDILSELFPPQEPTLKKNIYK